MALLVVCIAGSVVVGRTEEGNAKSVSQMLSLRVNQEASTRGSTLLRLARLSFHPPYLEAADGRQGLDESRILGNDVRDGLDVRVEDGSGLIRGAIQAAPSSVATRQGDGAGGVDGESADQMPLRLSDGDREQYIGIGGDSVAGVSRATPDLSRISGSEGYREGTAPRPSAEIRPDVSGLNAISGTASHYGESYEGGILGCGRYDSGDGRYHSADTSIAATNNPEWGCFQQLRVCARMDEFSESRSLSADQLVPQMRCIEVIRQDSCPGCRATDIDLSEAGFEIVCGPLSVGRCAVEISVVNE